MSRKNPKKLLRKQKQAAASGGDGEEPGEKSFRDSWEFRSGKFALRMAAVLIFLGYLGLTGASALNWMQLKWTRAQSLERLPHLADRYLNKVFKPEKLNKWVSMRRREETEDIIALLMPYTGRLPTFTFLYYSIQLKELGKLEDALFWWQFARYRARFDALRCGSVMAVENLDEILSYVPHPEFPPDTEQDSKNVIESLVSVLELDAHYPAENLPEELCDPIRALEPGKFKSVDVESWRGIRYTLRFMTERRIEKMSEEIGIEPQVRFPPTVVIRDESEIPPPSELIQGKSPQRPKISTASSTALLAAGLGQLAIFLLIASADRRRKEEDGGKEDDGGAAADAEDDEE